MKLIFQLIGCIIAIFSLIFGMFFLWAFAFLGKECYIKCIRGIKRYWRITIIICWKIRKRLCRLYKIVGGWVKYLGNKTWLTSKQIASHMVAFILLWTIPSVFVFSVVSISNAEKEKSFQNHSLEIEHNRTEMELKLLEYTIEKKMDSLKMLQIPVPRDTTSKY